MSVELTNENFEKQISEGVTLVDFWAPWCGYCTALAPIVEEAASEAPNVTLGKVNTDNSPEIAERFGIAGLPTLVLFKDGKEVSRSVGAVPKESVLELINKA